MLGRLKAALNKLLAQKLVVALIVAIVSAFSTDLHDDLASGTVLSTHLLVSLAIGAVAGGITRVLLAFGPVDIVPSDAQHSLVGAKKPKKQLSVHHIGPPRPRQTLPALPPHPALVNGSFGHLKLGKSAVKRDRRTLRFAWYFRVEQLPPIPPLFEIASKVASWPMYGNDRLGDCTCAAVGHMIQAWTAAAGKLVTLTKTAIVTAYWQTGTPPHKTGKAGGKSDTGRVELDILNYWRKTGVDGHKITAYAALVPANHDHMRAGAYLFGGLYLGVSLPETAQNQHVWDVVGDGKTGQSAPGSWGGHAVPVVAYDDEGVTVVTWGGLLKATWAFVDAYCQEAYAVLSPDWVSPTGFTTAGFDVASLLNDLAEIEAQAA